MERAIFCIAIFVAYIVQGITGFAGGMLAMPVGLNTVGLTTSILTINVCGIVACGMVALMARKSINFREVVKVCLVMIPFIALGIFFDATLPLDILMRVYGVIVIIAAARALLFPNSADFPEWVLWIILFLSGIIQGMFASGGAFLVLYAIQKFKDKEEFRATLSCIWVVLNCLYTLFQVQTGAATSDNMTILAVCVPLMFLASFLGSRIEKHITQETFGKCVNVLLLVIGIILIATA